MTRLSDIQLILLSTAASRVDGNLLPPPETLVEHTARIRKMIPSLLKRELVAEVDVMITDAVWREEDERKIGLTITAAGRSAIGVQDLVPNISSQDDGCISAGTAPSPKTASCSKIGPIARFRPSHAR